MRIGTSDVGQFVRDGIQRRIFVPGDADVHFELPENRLQVVFCHEGHIHVGGTDEHLSDRFVNALPLRDFFRRKAK